MKQIKVTQIRSTIKRDETQKRTIQALGLGKINRSKIHNDTPAIRGMINKVHHLVMVEDVVPAKTAEPEVKKEKPAVKKASENKAEKPQKTEKGKELTEKKEDPKDQEPVKKPRARKEKQEGEAGEGKKSVKKPDTGKEKEDKQTETTKRVDNE